MICAAAMSLSSFFVVTNALRINLFKIKPEDKSSQGARKTMTKTVRIEGMMCPHCEMNVKQALEAFAEVDCAEVSHKEGTAVLTLNADLDDAKIKEAVEAKGYKLV